MVKNIIIALLLVAVAVAFYTPRDTGRMVYNECQKARITSNPDRCRELQKRYHYEYICNDTSCWVESNNNL